MTCALVIWPMVLTDLLTFISPHLNYMIVQKQKNFANIAIARFFNCLGFPPSDLGRADSNYLKVDIEIIIDAPFYIGSA